MKMHSSALRFCTETMLVSPLKYYRSRSFLASYPQRSAFHYGEKSYPHICFLWLAVPSVKIHRRMSWVSCSMADGSRSNSSESSTNRTTRLIRNIQSFQTKLSTRITQLKKGLSIKIFFFLVGFYCATAFATVIGQTGDWDILSAGLAVVVVEGIGALMYRASLPFVDKIRNLVTVFNYWKAGLSLGLFLDAFKYEIDMFYESCKPFNIEIDIFPIFW
ncbi:ycf20-like protein [Canna indica]|uniref:Ycf20-like protein n=1 Tax=Canna indica TaxID=4628 RepID=A0AAQ3JRB0_9LILI|nr:ycf20-like protein [Canna indica]